MAWFSLAIAGLLEVGWALGMKHSDGLNFVQRPTATVVTLLMMFGSFGLLAYATKSLPIGTAYAVWVGIGAAGAAIGGIWLFEEPAAPLRLVFLGLLIVAIAGLKATSGPA